MNEDNLPLEPLSSEDDPLAGKQVRDIVAILKEARHWRKKTEHHPISDDEILKAKMEGRL